jgi:3',5'-cyclic-AMP phosphodiesterase
MPEITGCTTLLHITDTHILAAPEATLLGVNTAHYFQAVLKQAFANYHVDLVLLTGDLAQDPCVASYQFIYDALAIYNTPSLCLPGNHDDYTLMQQVFNTESISCRKQVLIKNWQCLSLNSQIIGANGGYLAEEELEFLDTCLAAHPQHYTLLAMHHHCVKTQSIWMDTMIIANRQQLFDVVSHHSQLKAIVHGHIHQNLDAKIANVHVLGTPSTCFQFKPKAHEFELDDTSPGYRIIRLYDDGQITSEVMRLSAPLQGLQLHTHGY